MVATVLLVVLTPARAGAAVTPFCSQSVARAVWTDEPQGSRIKVFPTGCGRRTAFLATKAVFAEALNRARPPGRRPVHRRSLYLQLRCHAYFAPFKRSWNLEAWRPIVSPKRLVKALCNPAGQVPHSFAAARRAGLVAQIVTALSAASR